MSEKPRGKHKIANAPARAEEILRESEARYRAIFEQATESIALIDAEARMLEFNTPAHEKLGYTWEEFQELQLSDIEVVESPEETKAHMERIAREARSVRWLERSICRSRSRRKDAWHCVRGIRNPYARI